MTLLHESENQIQLLKLMMTGRGRRTLCGVCKYAPDREVAFFSFSPGYREPLPTAHSPGRSEPGPHGPGGGPYPEPGQGGCSEGLEEQALSSVKTGWPRRVMGQKGKPQQQGDTIRSKDSLAWCSQARLYKQGAGGRGHAMGGPAVEGNSMRGQATNF